jgi:peptidoglycan/xylan/chitin deacetylase (PgdA/CDA1 family)
MNRVKVKQLGNSIWVLVCLSWVISLSGCAGVQKGWEKKEDTVAPLSFRSEDYIVYRLRANDSAGTLAEKFLKDRNKAWVIEEANEKVPFKEGSFIVIPLKEEKRGGLAPEGYQEVPILCYHRFADRCESSLCMTTALFSEQMRYLKENHYQVISMSDLADFLAYRRALPAKSVVINLDDGYRSAYEVAYPILKKHGFTATIFIYTDFVGATANSLTWDQLQKMKADGFEVGSHSVSHCDLTKEKEGEDNDQYMERIRRELFLSKQIIDQKLNQNTAYFAFPYGDFNHRVLSLCEEAGYKLGLSVKRGGNPFFSDPLVLRRDQILRKDMESFIKTLNTFFELPLR